MFPDFGSLFGPFQQIFDAFFGIFEQILNAILGGLGGLGVS